MTKIYIAVILISIALCNANQATLAQDKEEKSIFSAIDHYRDAMRDYEAKQFASSAKRFAAFYETNRESATQNQLYNGACIFALAGETDQAFDALRLAAEKHFYSNIDHLGSDSDLESLHGDPRWIALIERVKANKSTQPKRTREKVKSELLKAKAILNEDAGKLWGVPIWSNDIIVLDFDNTIYSFEKFPDSETDDDIMYYKKNRTEPIEFHQLCATVQRQTVRGRHG